jgi:pre-mRNA-splicing factor ISY1
MLREIDAEYYGYLDDDDNLLVPQEEKCEREARQLKIEEFKKRAENVENMETNEEIKEEILALNNVDVRILNIFYFLINYNN